MINQKTTSAQMTNTNSDIIITDWSDIYVINDDDLFIDFMETYGAENVKFWEEYQEQVENLDQEIVDTFLQIWTLDDVANVQDAFYGQYESTGTFAEDFYTQILANVIPDGIVVDWEATWNYSLRYDFIFEVSTGYTGYIFDRNW
jgi:hypothetical protein